jgi:serine/threonine protein kinase
MSLSPGTRLGPCEIVAPLGAGGMGEVYKATDTRLNRTVAIKALHDLFAHHPERVARFEREAQILASLNHPNIAAIHGLEEVAGAKFLVLEFVDGRTLADAIAARAMPPTDALAIARQIADALTRRQADGRQRHPRRGIFREHSARRARRAFSQIDQWQHAFEHHPGRDTIPPHSAGGTGARHHAHRPGPELVR